MKKCGKENDTLDALSHFLASSSIIEMIKAKVFPKASEKVKNVSHLEYPL
jgi:hypothetical protein